MLFKLRDLFKKFIDTTSSILVSKEKLVSSIEEFKLELISRDVAFEVAENVANRLLDMVENKEIRNKHHLVNALRSILLSYFEEAGSIGLIELATSRRPFKMLFLGVNGVGKTTTIAKVAVYFKDNGFRPLMVAADTFRAAAQEQLKKHSERTRIPVFMGKYGADPASVAYDSIQYAFSKGFDVLLIDTAGRMHTDIDLVNELKKVVRVVKPDIKILVVDALTGNDAVEQSRFFHEAIGIDGFIVTKFDAYEEGGVPISLVYVLKKPIIFIGTGQDYIDLKPFNPLEYLDKVLPYED
ncbi:MAG: signal recognition particle-docking protein FtsY [Desulfurococcaceae archaeon]